METAAQDSYQAVTLAVVSRTLWNRDDAIERILRGESPTDNTTSVDEPNIVTVLAQISELTKLAEELVAAESEEQQARRR